MTSDEQSYELWSRGDAALRTLAGALSGGDKHDVLDAKTTLAGTLALLTANDGRVYRRALRLHMLLMFTAELSGRYSAAERAGLPTFILAINGVRPDWATTYALPSGMTWHSWAVLTRLVQGSAIDDADMQNLRERHPTFSHEMWLGAAHQIRKLPILGVVLY